MPGSTAVGLSFDTTSIKQADEAIKKLVKNAETGIGKVNKAWKDMTKDGLNHFIERLRAAQKDIAKLSSAQIKVTVSGQADDLKKLGDSASGAIPQVNKLITAMQQLSAIHVNTVGNGGVSVMDAQKVNYLQQQIKLLQDQLKIQQEIGQAVERQAGSTSRVRNGMSGIEDTARKVRQIAGTLFSIQALSGYVNKLVAVRGEFELQQRALQAIVQNIDEANKLWEKTVALAVQSPFRVRELVTYTKQLAAYRVETEKLYDTTKMLADVSAGLGVDMNRLILAFGQVKAANFLRGTELRQFSEAGINILGELSTYFTELEGRVVTVGDVFERVSKRMVSFADVEEIFKRITSEGGAFFNMQEIQAETLKGQIANLKDSIDLMLNDIGKANEKTIKNMVAFTRTLIEGWRVVGGMLSSLGAAFAVVTVARVKDSFATITWTKKNLEAIASGKGLSAVLAKMKLAFDSLKTAMLTNPITATYAALAALAVVIYKVVKRQRELNREYEESVGKIHAQYIETKKHADSIKELVERQNELIEANKNLSQDSDEYKENQREISDIEERRKEVIKELVKIDPEYAKSIKNAGSDLEVLIPLAEEYNEKLRARLALESSLKEINVDDSSEKYNDAVTEQRAALGNLEKTRNILLKQAQELLSSNTLYDSERKALEDFVNGREPYYKRAIKLREDLQKVFLDLGTSEQAYGLGTRTVKKTGVSTLWQRLDIEATSAIEKYIKALGKLSRKEKKVVNDMSSVAEEFKGLEMGARLTSILADENATQEDKDKAKNQIIDFFEEVLNEKGIVGAIADKARSLWSSIFNFDWKKVVIPTKLTGWRAAYDEFLKTLSTKAVPSITEEEDESDYIETLKKTYESYAEDIEGWDANNAKLRAQYSKDEIDAIRLQNAERKKALDWLVYEKKEESSDSNENDELKRLNERIKLVRELRKEYEDLNKTFGKAESEERVRSSYREAWESIMPKDLSIDLFDFTDPKGVAKQLEELKSRITPEAIELVKAIEKAIAGERVEIDVDFKKGKDKELLNEIEALFDRYDLTLDLKKLNLPEGVAEQLFNIDYLDLDELRAAIKAREAEFIGTDMEDQYKDYLDKIDEMERKAIIERTKVYSEYLVKGMNERVKLKVEELRKLKELEESKEFNPDQKEQIRGQIKADTQKALDKESWKQFQATEWYTLMFADLETLGTQAIKNLHDELSQLKDSLSHLDPSEVKEIVNQMDKLQEQLIKRNPFKAFVTARQNIKALAQSEEDVMSQLKAHEDNQAYAQKMLDMLAEIEVARAEYTLGDLQGETLSLFQSLRAEVLAGNTNAFKDAREEYEGLLAKAKEGADLTSEQIRMFAQYRQSLKGISDYWSAINDQIQNITGSAVNIMEVYGVDEATKSIAEGVGSMSTLIMQAIQFGIQMELVGYKSNMALGVIGWIAMGMQAISTVITAIANYKNAKIDAQLEKNAKILEKQRDLYEQIEEKVDKAYSVDQLRQYNGELKKNIELEIQALQASIALEKSRKNSDEGQIDAWEKEIQEAKERLAETTQEMTEMVGGIFDTTDFTSGFVDAWWEAMDEGMDALDALNEHFEETMKDMVKKQALYQGANAIMKQVQDVINKDLAEDYDIDDWAKIWDVAKKANIDLDAFLQGWYDMFGAFSGAEGSGLSALQKGIHSLSESTGQVIESLLNSLRFYVADSNSELKSQTKYMRDMYNLLNGMIGTHSQGGRGIKVVM